MSIKLNSYGVNKLIKYTILSDEKMKEIGFCKNYHEGTIHETYSPWWWFTRKIKFPKKKDGMMLRLAFCVQIPKDGSDIDIFVIDCDWCQPYDYQRILHNNPNHECANIVKEQVEKWIKYLQGNGVISGHTYGECIKIYQ